MPSPSPQADALSAKIADRSAVAAACGPGCVGLPLARAVLDAGFRVLGFDTDPEKIAAPREDPPRNRVPHLGPACVADLLATGRFEAAGNPARLAAAGPGTPAPSPPAAAPGAGASAPPAAPG